MQKIFFNFCWLLNIGSSSRQEFKKRFFSSFQDLCELTRITLVELSTQDKLNSALELIVETSQDFTDSAYTSHENRERILDLCDQLRAQLVNLINVGTNLVSKIFHSESLLLFFFFLFCSFFSLLFT